MLQEFKHTPLFANQLQLGAKMGPFAGWEMPVSYKSILEEHRAVRAAAGIFDICHMGLIKIEGAGAFPFLQATATNDLSTLEENNCQYSLLCNSRGGVEDDLLIYRFPAFYLVVCNAVNKDKVLPLLKSSAAENPSVTITELGRFGMLSLQGPLSEKFTAGHFVIKLSSLKKNHALQSGNIIISRTGYTGEDGFELILPFQEIEKAWSAFLAAGVSPCGLGARDTLRIEAGLPLFGHEYNTETSPIDAGYGWAVKFKKGNFIGREALLLQKEKGSAKQLVGLAPEGRAIPRQGDLIYTAGGVAPIGEVTSGTFSPSLNKPIALAYLSASAAKQAVSVEIDIRNHRIPAKVVAKTFYKR